MGPGPLFSNLSALTRKNKLPGVRAALLMLALLLGLAPAARAQGDPPPLAFEAIDPSGGADLVLARARHIDLENVPLLPTVNGRTRATYARGQALGRDPGGLSKVGDCNSTEWLFLHAFGEGQYDLGPYTDLAGVIAQFEPALARRTYAAYNGLNALALHDPLWANPAVCEPGESPLLCEIRVHNPAIAVIMFGTNDIVTINPQQFDAGLRRAVAQSLAAGVVPLLSTFPRYLDHPDQSMLYNQIVVRVAWDFGVPLLNLWRALEPLPNYGIAADGFHLNGPLTAAGDLASSDNLQTGYPMRNLVTLQALDVLWRGLVDEPDEPDV